jgi:hypothetical protein
MAVRQLEFRFALPAAHSVGFRYKLSQTQPESTVYKELAVLRDHDLVLLAQVAHDVFCRCGGYLGVRSDNISLGSPITAVSDFAGSPHAHALYLPRAHPELLR